MITNPSLNETQTLIENPPREITMESYYTTNRLLFIVIFAFFKIAINIIFHAKYEICMVHFQLRLQNFTFYWLHLWTFAMCTFVGTSFSTVIPPFQAFVSSKCTSLSSLYIFNFGYGLHCLIKGYSQCYESKHLIRIKRIFRARLCVFGIASFLIIYFHCHQFSVYYIFALYHFFVCVLLPPVN